MFTPKLTCLLLTALAVGSLHQVKAQEGPGLGIPITPTDLAPWDISIETDGSGLPAGSGSVQAGQEIYQSQCIACHGIEGAGQPNDRLVGGHESLTQSAQIKTIGSYWPYASTVFDYIRRAMPFNSSQSLSDDEVYAVVAYLLFLNDIIDMETVLDADTLAEIEMPNVDGFVLSYP